MAITTRGVLAPGADKEMQSTLRGEVDRTNRARNAVSESSDDMVPDWIKVGQKNYFKDKSYTPEQRSAITTRAKRGIPLRARSK